MSRKRQVLAGILTVVAVVGCWVAVGKAQDIRSGDHTTVQPNETVNSTLYAAGRRVDIAGTVNGDVFCAGQNITISGTVNGDVICAGQIVRIAGTVKGDVRVASQNVDLEGTIKQNATMLGQSVNIDARGKVDNDATILGSDVTLDGNIGRDLTGTLGRATIDGHVGRNVQASTQTMSLERDAVIGGNLHYTSTKDIQRDAGAKVAGMITRSTPRPTAHHRSNFGHILTWVLLGSLLVTSLVLVLLFPRVFHGASTRARTSLLKTLGIGVLATVVAPILIGALMVSIVGLPLGLLALLTWIVLLILSGPFTAYLLGQLILQRSTNAIIWMLTGAIVLIILYLIPLINIIAMLLVVWIGVGMLIWHIVAHLTKPHYDMGLPVAAAPKLERNTKK